MNTKHKQTKKKTYFTRWFQGIVILFSMVHYYGISVCFCEIFASYRLWIESGFRQHTIRYFRLFDSYNLRRSFFAFVLAVVSMSFQWFHFVDSVQFFHIFSPFNLLFRSFRSFFVGFIIFLCCGWIIENIFFLYIYLPIYQHQHCWAMQFLLLIDSFA